MAGLDDTGQLLDVDVQQIAGGGVFVAHDGDFRFQHLGLVQLQPGQDTADGGAAQAGGLRDPHARPAFAAKPLDALDQFAVNAAGRSMGARRPVPQSSRTALAKPLDPLGSTLPAELVLGCRLAQAQPALHNALRQVPLD